MHVEIFIAATDIYPHLNNSTEPAGIADVLQAHWALSLSLSLMWVQRVYRDACQGETHVL